MIVALDLDNTLVEWQTHWANLYEQWFGPLLPVERTEPEPRFEDFVEPGGDELPWFEAYSAWLGDPLSEWDACLKYTHFETIDEFYQWYDKANGWATQPWTPGAQGFLYELDQHPHIDYRFVTARPTQAGALEAVQRVLPWGGALTVTNNTSKHTVKADIWVDDAPEVLESLAANGKKAIRFAQPWNEGVEAFAVANSWAEVLTILKENL